MHTERMSVVIALVASHDTYYFFCSAKRLSMCILRAAPHRTQQYDTCGYANEK